MPKISIVATFYNSEKYIRKLIDSVLAQTYNDWELICVDDCSPGNDFSILKECEKKDSRIRIISNKKNYGISKAKFRGIQESQGQYLCFIDGDDWLEPNALKFMIEPAIEDELDMVCMNSRKVLPYIGYSKNSCVNREFYNKVLQIDTKEGEGRINFERLYVNFFGINIFNVTYWGKLIKKSLIIDSKFTPPESVIGEDQVFTMTIFPYVKRMMFVDYIGYNWRWGGITSGKKNDIWTSEQYLIRSNDFFIERLKLIDLYEVPSYKSIMMIEQKNIFQSMIGNLALKDIDTEYAKNIIKFIDTILEPEFYTQFVHLKYDPLYPEYKNNFLLEAMINKDSMKIYQYCMGIYKKNRLRRFAKKLLHRVLYSLDF